jgi:hypothetical protein
VGIKVYPSDKTRITDINAFRDDEEEYNDNGNENQYDGFDYKNTDEGVNPEEIPEDEDDK